MLEETMLHIGLRMAVSRKSDIHAGEHLVLEEALPLGLIEKVRPEVALSEDEPRPALRPSRFSFLKKCTVWRNAGAGADHENGRIVIGQAKMRIALDIGRHARLGSDAVGEKAGGDAGAFLAVEYVAQ